MRFSHFLILGIAATAALLFAGPIGPDGNLGPASAHAKDPMFGKPWSFNVRGNVGSANRAMMMWQIDQASAANTAFGGSTGGAAAGLGAAGGGAAIANYNDVRVIMGDGASGVVSVHTGQDSVGDQTSQTETATEFYFGDTEEEQQ